MLRVREGSIRARVPHLLLGLLGPLALTSLSVLLLLMPRPVISDSDFSTDSIASEEVEHFIARTSELAETGHIHQAIRLLRGRIQDEIEPAHQLALRGSLGDTYLILGDLDAALAEYDAILSDWPKLGLVHFKRGQVLEKMLNHLPAAIKAYETSIQLGYSKSSVFTRLGFSYKTLSEFEDRTEAEQAELRQRAAFYYEQSLEQDPADISALGNLADLHAGFGSSQKALSLYARLTGMRPTDPIVHARLGVLLLKLDQPEPARAALTRAASLARAQRSEAPEMRAHVLRDVEATARLKLAELMLAADEHPAAQRELEAVRELARCSRCKFRSQALEASGQLANELLTELAADSPGPAAPESVRP